MWMYWKPSSRATCIDSDDCLLTRTCLLMSVDCSVLPLLSSGLLQCRSSASVHEPLSRSPSWPIVGRLVVITWEWNAEVQVACITPTALSATQQFAAQHLTLESSILLTNMSRASTYTLDHEWDPYEILDVERDRRCVGWAPSMGRKCRKSVNWEDMDTFYGLLDKLSSHALDATRLQPCLRALAAVGLCKQVHRRSQIDDMVDKWSKNIRAAARKAELDDLEVESYYSRTDTRSSTASFRTPATRRARSPTSTNTVRTSSTAQDEIESTLRCLEAARNQQRVLERRLASLQTPNRSPPQRAIQDRIAPAPSSPDASSVASTRTLRDQSSSSSHRSTSTRSTVNSSSSDSSSPPDHRRLPLISTLPTLPTPPSSRQYRHIPHFSIPSQTPLETTMSASTPPTEEPLHPFQQGLDLLWREFLTTQVLHGSITASSLADFEASSLFLGTDFLHTISSTTNNAPSTIQRPPRCTQTHVRRLPIADECPICYEAMTEEGLVWCKRGCGQSVHGECMDAWKASLVAGGNLVRCTMCRGRWEDGECGC